MSFEVKYTARARQDLRNIYEYIAYDLLVPEAKTDKLILLEST